MSEGTFAGVPLKILFMKPLIPLEALDFIPTSGSRQRKRLQTRRSIDTDIERKSGCRKAVIEVNEKESFPPLLPLVDVGDLTIALVFLAVLGSTPKGPILLNVDVCLLNARESVFV